VCTGIAFIEGFKTLLSLANRSDKVVLLSKTHIISNENFIYLKQFEILELEEAGDLWTKKLQEYLESHEKSNYQKV